MTVTALAIVTDSYERLNRLSPGETLADDDASRGLTRLNVLIDELSVKRQFLYRNVLTSAAQTGHITLGAGSWAALPPGTPIVSATVDGYAMQPLDMTQYQMLSDPTQTGTPGYYAADGLSTVYLYPVATGQTVQLLTLTGAAAFADLTTAYTVPPGYKHMLGAVLARKLASVVLGRVPSEIDRDANSALSATMGYKPAILDVSSYARSGRVSSILQG